MCIRWVHQILINQGNLVNFMFWDAFEGLHIAKLEPCDEVLVRFSVEQVQVRDYISICTTFAYDKVAHTLMIKYIVVQALSSYNSLLGQPTLKRLGVDISTKHLKVKYPIG